MEKDFVPYKESLELKELGFDEPCFGAFNKSGGFQRATSDWWDKDTLIRINSSTYADLETLAPLYQQAFKFFREKYGYDVTIKKCTPSEYKFQIEQLFVEGDSYYFIDFPFKTYGEAELECLKKLIKIVKGK